jgi:hypothetical protein
MNCQAFESLIDELASGRPALGTDGVDALIHAESCPRCSARLANERALSAIFQFAAAETVDAPGHVETALLEAFRGRHRGPAPETAARPSFRIVPAAWWGIAAALAVALIGISTFEILRSHKRTVVPVTSLPTGVFSPRDVRPAESPAAGTMQASLAAPVVPVADSQRASDSAPRPAAAANNKAVEIATDFYALTSDSGLATMESGQLVRVLVPRSAMAACGLPVNQEIADTPVTAQVLVGQDGVARAIRFLSNSNPAFLKTGMQTRR